MSDPLAPSPASGNGTRQAKPPAAAVPDRSLLDLDALAPIPPSRYRVKVDGVEYPVRQMMQLTGQEELDLMGLDRAVEEAKTYQVVRRAMFDRAFHLVRVLVPEMPDRVRFGLPYARALAIADQAWAYAAATAEPTVNPPEADMDAALPVSEARSSVPAENSRPVSAAPMGAIPAS